MYVQQTWYQIHAGVVVMTAREYQCIALSADLFDRRYCIDRDIVQR